MEEKVIVDRSKYFVAGNVTPQSRVDIVLYKNTRNQSASCEYNTFFLCMEICLGKKENFYFLIIFP